jgi:hypothetical protein
MRRLGVVGLVLGLCLAPLLGAAACGSEFHGSDDDTGAGSGGGAGDTSGEGGSGAATGGSAQGGSAQGGSARGGSSQGGADPGGADQGGATATGGSDRGGTTARGGMAGAISTGGTAGAISTGGTAGAVSTGGTAGTISMGGTAGTISMGGTAGALGGMGGLAGSGSGPATEGLVYWFSADVGVDVTNGGVARWNDRSMNQADAAQLTSAARPRLATLGDSTLPALVFDGTDDYLGLPPLTATFSKGVSFFAVARATNAAACSSLMQLSNGSEIDDISVDRQNGSLVYEVYSAFLAGQDGAFAVDETRLAEVIQSPDGDVTLWLNGLATGVGSFELPVAVDRNQTFIGRSLYLNCPTFGGEIAEIVFYARAVTADERRAIETYLSDKWQCCGR